MFLRAVMAAGFLAVHARAMAVSVTSRLASPYYSTVLYSTGSSYAGDEPPVLREPNGLMAVHKPKGVTSSAVVGRLRREIERAIDWRNRPPAAGTSHRRRKMYKVGHGGTLDPMATGVLVVGIGSGTKLLGKALSGSKMYRATGMFGYETDTLDAEGELTERGETDHITCDLIESSLHAFRGEIHQIPPMYSALKRNGKKLYELAREGKSVERDPRRVTIHKLTLLSDDDYLPYFDIHVHCSSGTYIRTLVSDIAHAINSRAHMTSLERTQQDPFTLEHCLQEEEWTYESVCAHLERHASLWKQ